MATETQIAKDKLIADFKAIVTDSEDLLRATASQTGEKVTAVRARIEDNLKVAKSTLADLQDDMMARTRAAARATDELVHEKPWESVAIAAAVGFLLGMLTGRR